MRTKFKAWTVPYLEEHPEVAPSFEDIQKLAAKEKVFLEIGCGKGDFICQMALNNPDLYFIGVEKSVTCAGITAKKIVEQEIKNAVIIPEDVEKMFELIKDNTFDGVLLNFSDPWPKKRHTKRRLTDERFIDNYYRIIKQNGILNFKTDNADLFAFSVEEFQNSKFTVLSVTDDYPLNGAEFDATTEYEKNFRAKGTPIHRICLKKER